MPIFMIIFIKEEERKETREEEKMRRKRRKKRRVSRRKEEVGDSKAKAHGFQHWLVYCKMTIMKFYFTVSLYVLFLEYMKLNTHFRRFC